MLSSFLDLQLRSTTPFWLASRWSSRSHVCSDLVWTRPVNSLVSSLTRSPWSARSTKSRRRSSSRWRRYRTKMSCLPSPNKILLLRNATFLVSQTIASKMLARKQHKSLWVWKLRYIALSSIKVETINIVHTISYRKLKNLSCSKLKNLTHQISKILCFHRYSACPWRLDTSRWARTSSYRTYISPSTSWCLFWRNTGRTCGPFTSSHPWDHLRDSTNYSLQVLRGFPVHVEKNK